MVNKDIENTFIYLAQSLVAGVCTILLYPIITDNLEPDVFGLYVLSTVYASIIIGIANLGCVAGYERNFFLHENSSVKTGSLLSTVQVFVAVVFLLVVLLGWLTRDAVSLFLFKDTAYSDLWWLVILGVGLSSFSQYYLTYLKNSGFASAYFKMTVLQVGVNFVLTYCLFIYFDLGVFSLAYAFLISNIVLLFSLLMHQFYRLSLGFDLSLLKDVLIISIPLTPKVLFGFLNTQFDKIMLGMLSSLGNIGVYAIAQRIALSVFSLMTSLDRVFKPNVYRMLFSDADREKIGKYLVPYIYMSIFPAIVIILFSSDLLSLLVSESYLGGASILVVLCIYYSMMFFGKICGTQLTFAKKTWLTSKLMLWGVMLNVILNIPMIMIWGGLGAALATTLAGFIMIFVYYYYAQQYAKIRWVFVDTFKIYSILFVSSLYVLAVDFNVISSTSINILFGKLAILLMFIFLGWQIGLLSKSNILNIRKLMQARLFR